MQDELETTDELIIRAHANLRSAVVIACGMKPLPIPRPELLANTNPNCVLTVEQGTSFQTIAAVAHQQYFLDPHDLPRMIDALQRRGQLAVVHKPEGDWIAPAVANTAARPIRRRAERDDRAAVAHIASMQRRHEMATL